MTAPQVTPGALRLRLADGETVAVEELGEALARLGEAVEVARWAGGDPWAVVQAAGDAVELAVDLGVLTRPDPDPVAAMEAARVALLRALGEDR
jgi:hypothetical protein